MQQPCCCGK